MILTMAILHESHRGDLVQWFKREIKKFNGRVMTNKCKEKGNRT